jgi:hypothetical protein
VLVRVFDGLEIYNLETGEAVLSGNIVDQAALHGVLTCACLEFGARACRPDHQAVLDVGVA